MSVKVVLPVFLLASFAHARVFHLKEQTAGTYIQGTVGNSLLSDSAYSNHFVTIENKVDYNASGEFGLMFKASRSWIRLGVEIIRPHVVDGAQATDASGATLYRVTSGVLAWGPKLSFEFPLGVFEKTRFFFTGGGGYMKVTVKNDYKFTTYGNTVYSLADYTEEASAYSISGEAGLGMEVALADYSTFILMGGYRTLLANSLQEERSTPSMGGQISVGDIMKNSHGQDVNLDLSGAWVGIGLRFYWNF